MTSSNGTPARRYKSRYGVYAPARSTRVDAPYVLISVIGDGTFLGVFPTIEAAEAALPPCVRIQGLVRIEDDPNVAWVSPTDNDRIWFSIERAI